MVEGHFQAVTARCGELCRGKQNTVRTPAATLYRHATLLPYRERMEKLGLVASALYHLAPASGEQVEEVLTVRESGRELDWSQHDLPQLAKDD